MFLFITSHELACYYICTSIYPSHVTFFSPQKYILSHEAHEHRVSSGLIALYVAYLNQTSTVLTSGSTIYYMSDSLIQFLVVHRSRETKSRLHRLCVLGVLTELTHSPYTWTHYPETVRLA